jgi:hypothetical protein
MPCPCRYFIILYNSRRKIKIEGKGTAIVAETAGEGVWRVDKRRQQNSFGILQYIPSTVRKVILFSNSVQGKLSRIL